GYAGVEFAGYYGCTAEELKKFLGDSGLKPCGTHTGYGSIKPDQIEQTIEFNKGYGNKYLVVPGGVPGNDEDTWKQHAEMFSKAAETAKKAGMYVGYHNHQHEFKKFPNGKCAWEVLFENASPDVFQQMDIGHCAAAGEDPIFWLKKFPKRLRTVHAKEVYGKEGYNGVLGVYPEGGKFVDWDAVFPVLEADGLEWYIVESEARSNTLEDVKGCVDFLKKKGRA
ncbi:MAG: sugar phosphate isomerase/epimerase, partial [Planctomycetaceae bacterium]|nr:sugar phosphate isomerase/epimerase [Planctomycetaceae bacterium]